MQKKIVIILAGGQGSRLKSITGSLSKQLFKVGSKTFFKHTLDRLAPLREKNISLAVVAPENILEKIKKLYPEQDLLFIKEPEQKNTGPAIFFSCKFLSEKFENPVVTFLPCDHWIEKNDEFLASILSCLSSVEKVENKLFLLASKAKEINESLGFLTIKKSLFLEKEKFFTLLEFYEKPKKEAQEKLKALKSAVFENLGVFTARATTILKNYKTSLELKLPFDKAFLEKNKDKILVRKVYFSWLDLGTKDNFLAKKGSFS